MLAAPFNKACQLALWAFASLVTAATARADTDVPLAEWLFRAGRDAMKRGDFAEACRNFRASERVERAVGTELNLALCEEREGRLVSARARLATVIGALTEGDERLEIARSHALKLEVRMPKLLLRAAHGLPPKTTVRVGSRTFRPLLEELTVWVDPGAVHVEVASSGRIVQELDLTIAETQTIICFLPNEPRPREVTTSNTWPSMRDWAIVAIGFGAAGLVVGGMAGAATLREKSAVDVDCGDRGCGPSGLAAAERGHWMASLSTASTLLGASVAGVGVMLLWRSTQGATLRVGASPPSPGRSGLLGVSGEF